MRFAAIADIHGNCLALEAVLADIAAQGIVEIVNLGDHLSGPLQPLQTAELLMQKAFVSIMGNQDRRMVELFKTGGASNRIDTRQLAQRHFDWMAAQPATLLWHDDIFLCHGSPLSDEAYWLETVSEDGRLSMRPREAIEKDAEDVTASLVLCAHTHIPRVVRLGDGRLVVNPGSVGLPGYRDTAPFPHAVESGSPDASYAILERHASRWQVSLRYVPYDNLAMSALALSNGNAVWASALSTGWVRP